MTAKELVGMLIEEGVPPAGWGRWVWRGRDGYGISSLVHEDDPPPVVDDEKPLFWWGGLRVEEERFLAVEEVRKALVGVLLRIVLGRLPWGVANEFLLALHEMGQEGSLERE